MLIWKVSWLLTFHLWYISVMKLSKIEKEILCGLELSGDMSTEEIASMIGYSARSVRYYTRRLEDKGLLEKPAFFLDVHPLGLSNANIYFSAMGSSDFRKRLVATCNASKQVSWLAELGGDFHYGLSLTIRKPGDVAKNLVDLSKTLPNLFHEKSHIFHVSLSVFPKKYLRTKPARFEALTYGHSKVSTNVDELDKRILFELSARSLESTRTLGKRVGCSHVTIDSRIKRLRKGGIIKGVRRKINVELLGYQRYKILVYTRGVHPELTLKLQNFASKHPHVVNFIECLGSWDYELGVEVLKASDLNLVTYQLYDTFGDFLLTLKILPVLKVIKVCPYPSIEI